MSEPRLLCYLGPPDQVGGIETVLGPRWSVVRAENSGEVDAVLPEAHAVLDAFMRVRFDADRLSPARRLSIISAASTGIDHIDVAAANEFGITVESIAGRDVVRELSPAAEMTWALVLALARRLGPAVQSVHAGEWQRERFPGVMLRRRTLGVIGMGRIGRWVSGYGAAFGMRVVGYDPFVRDWPDEIERSDDLMTLCQGADVITVHVPLSSSTVGLVGSDQIARMRRHTLLVNTSRGDVVDEAALVVALRSERLGGYATDVLAGEPDISDHPLVALARDRPDLVAVTPHIGGFSPDALALVLGDCCTRILSHLASSE